MTPSPRPRTLSLVQARRIVRSTARGGIARAHGKGFAWLRSRLLPALRILERAAKTRKERLWLSGAYYVLGDIHDFNHAPRAAIVAYRKSLRLDPRQAAAWREIGGMLRDMGHRAGARGALRRAVALDPEDAHAKSDLAYLDQLQGSASLFRQGDHVWEADELLARGKRDDAWKLVRGARGPRGLLCAARILGACGDSEGVMGTWDRIVRARGPVDLRYGDWFFLPRAVFEAPAFWSALWKLGGRLETCVFVTSGTLWYARPKRPKARSRAMSSGDSVKGYQRLMIRYNLARTRGDVGSLRALLQRYPTWKEPRDVLARLVQRGGLQGKQSPGMPLSFDRAAQRAPSAGHEGSL
jgi:tetratricopeptide (TPR) repeat protein